jgi:hypothetical protein
MELRNVNNRSHLACGTVSSFCESYKPWLLDIRIECGKQRDNLSFLSRYSTLDGENTNIRTVRHAADVISISIFVDSEENPVIFAIIGGTTKVRDGRSALRTGVGRTFPRLCCQTRPAVLTSLVLTLEGGCLSTTLWTRDH